MREEGRPLQEQDALPLSLWCIGRYSALCVGKDEGATCDMRKELKRYSVCGNVTTTALYSQALGSVCEGSTCRGCMEPKDGACLGKKEGDACAPYKEHYFDTNGRGGGKQTGYYAYSGGKCWKKGGVLACEGAKEVGLDPQLNDQISMATSTTCRFSLAIVAVVAATAGVRSL